MGRLSSLLPTPKQKAPEIATHVVETTDSECTSVSLISRDDPAQESPATGSTSLLPVSLASGTQVIAMQYDETGEKRWEVLARVGHGPERLVQATPQDLLPKDLPDAAQVPTKPDDAEVSRQLEATQMAINQILAGKSAAGAIKTSDTAHGSASIVRYTGKDSVAAPNPQTRLVKVVELPRDPLDPPKFTHRRAPKPPPSPPAPVLHSPPRKVTTEEQRAWHIPPCVSSWKNPKGYTIPLDKRLAADGRGLQEQGVSEGFTSLAEALYLAERHAREEVEKRALLEQKLAERERSEQEERLRQLADKARYEREAVRAEDVSSHSRSMHESKPIAAEDSKFGPMRVHGSEKGMTLKEREELRRQMSREREREMRMSQLAGRRSEQRDLSEKAALGHVGAAASSSASTGEALFDQRLFDQTAGLDQGFHDDEAYNIYDRPLFGASSAAHLIYRPGLGGGDALDDGDAAVESENGQMKELMRGGKAFQGGDGSRAAGPVEFEAEEDVERQARSTRAGSIPVTSDPFGLDQFLAAAKDKARKADTKFDPSEAVAKRRR